MVSVLDGGDVAARRATPLHWDRMPRRRRRRRRPPRRRGLAALAVVALGARRRRRRARARSAIDRYLAAWARGDDARRPRLTDRPGAAAPALLAMSRAGLDGAKRDRAACWIAATADGESAARVRVTWEVPRFGALRLRGRVVDAPSPATPSGACAGATPRCTRRWTRRHAARHARALAAARRDPRPRRPRAGHRARRWSTSRVQVDKVRRPRRDRRGARRGARRRRRRARRRDPRAPATGRFIPVITLRARGVRRGRGAARARSRGVSLDRTTAQLAPTRELRPRAARHGRPGDGRAGRARRRAARDRRRRRPVRARAGPRRARSPATPARSVVIRAARAGPSVRHARAPRRAAAGAPLRTLLDRDVQAAAESALDTDERGGARRGRAVDRRRARGRQPARRQHVRPRAARPLPAGLDVQGRQHRRAAARGPRPGRDRRLPGHARGRRASRSATSRAAPPARSRSATTSRRAATPRSSRSPGGSSRDALTRGRARVRARASGWRPACRAPRRRVPPPRDGVAPRRDDDRPGPDPRQPARDGGRRRDRRRRPLARAARARGRRARRRAAARRRRRSRRCAR